VQSEFRDTGKVLRQPVARIAPIAQNILAMAQNMLSDVLCWFVQIIPGGTQPGGSMTQSTKDHVKGTFHEVKGRAKEVVGQVTNNPTLEAKGTSEKLAGKVQKKVGQIERVFEK
jgi:uncharacterized protein YjbJ (UPF0337 family)